MRINENWPVQKVIIDFDRLMDLLGFENYADFYGINHHRPYSVSFNMKIDRLRPKYCCF